MGDILQIVSEEDARTPYNDEQLGDMLSISRFDVIRLRKKYGIPDYRKRRLPYLKDDIKKLCESTPNISVTELTDRLQELGYDISRFLVSELIKEKTFDRVTNNKPSFSGVIGANGSISKQFKQMKAALIYPPYGLHTLLIGETGTGKSLLVDAVYTSAINEGILDKSKKLIRLNCADYANNPELLASQIFGHVKGAYTGADSDKDGLVKIADKGILFLDEIHRLSAEGQEMLFSVIDNGKYRRLGESVKEESSDIMIIGATTEEINPSLLDTFKRRIPMLIELPPLRNRSIEERYKLITRFLQKEADKTQKIIRIGRESIIAFLSYECTGNIGQLLSDVKVSVAKAYLKTIESTDDEIDLELSDLPEIVQSGLIKNKYSEDVIRFSERGVKVKPNADIVDSIDEKEINWNPNNIYDFVKSKYVYLNDQDIPIEAIKDLLAKEIDYRVDKMMRTLQDQNGDTGEFTFEIEDETVKNVIETMLNMAENRIGEFKREVQICLRMNLNSLIHKIINDYTFINLEVDAIRQKYIYEYQLAREMLRHAADELDLFIPKEAIALTATYLKVNTESITSQNKKVKILVATHGNVAKEIANLVNEITDQTSVDHLSIPLDMNKKDIIEMAVEKANSFEEEGILLLVDIGSTLTLGEIIAKKTGKETKTVGRVDVAVALEAAVKSKLEGITLDEIYDYVKDKSVTMNRCNVGKINKGKRIILTMCITGHGAAAGIKTYIEESINEIRECDIDIIPIGIINENTDKYISTLAKENQLLAVVGSFKPDIENIEFIPIESIVDSDGISRLRNIINIKSDKNNKEQTVHLDSFIFEDAVFSEMAYAEKNEALIALSKSLEEKGYVTEKYCENVLKREKAIGTEFINGISIPHTYGKFVNKSVIGIATLKPPVKWNESYDCSIILMLALKDENTKVVKELYKFADDEALIESIYNSSNAEEIISVIKNYCKKSIGN